MQHKKTIVLSIGGSMVVPAVGDGVVFLKELKKLLFSYCKRGYRFVLVVGGGAPARMYQDRLRALGVKDNRELDWVGIYATHSNARFVARALAPMAEKEVITDPKQMLKSSKKIIIAGGHKPGSSSDYVAVQLAKRFDADYMVNISNVAYVYSEDPKKNPHATRYTLMTWEQMQKIVGTKWSPGMHTPFDPAATAFARKHALQVAMVDGATLGEFKKMLEGKPFKGTLVV